jgi:hypothetical protein
MAKLLEQYSITVVLFIILASMFLAIPLYFNIGTFISAAFIMAGMTCAILGCFVFMFTGKEPIDPQLMALLPIQSYLNIDKIMLDSGITGNAFFLPTSITGESRVMQFNSQALKPGSKGSEKESFDTSRWVAVVPSSYPLMQLLLTKNKMIIPDTPGELNILFNEIMCDIFEFASHVSAKWEAEKVTISLQNYQFVEGCIFAGVEIFSRDEFPDCFLRYPCPVCSLCGSLLAESTKKVIILDRCSATSSQDITMVFSISQQSVPDTDPAAARVDTITTRN